jgi:hypothetical protein
MIFLNFVLFVTFVVQYVISFACSFAAPGD